MNMSHSNEVLAAAAFSQQAKIFDQLYSGNTIIQYKRKRVRDHLTQYLFQDQFILN